METDSNRRYADPANSGGLFSERSVRVWQVLGGIVTVLTFLGGLVLLFVRHTSLLVIPVAGASLLFGAALLWRWGRAPAPSGHKLRFAAALAVTMLGAGALGGAVIALGRDDRAGSSGAAQGAPHGVSEGAGASSSVSGLATSTRATETSGGQVGESGRTSTSSAPPVDLDDPPSWRLPPVLAGTWTGNVVSRDGTDRIPIKLTLDGAGVGQGSKAGQVEFDPGTPCVAEVFLAELRAGNIAVLSPGREADACRMPAVTSRYILVPRQDNRLSIELEFWDYTGALQKSA